MDRLKLFIICLCLAWGTTLSAQGGKPNRESLLEVRLRVLDAAREPLLGATIKVQGKAQGVITDESGYANIWVAKGTAIQISYVGMKPQILTIKKNYKGDIVLQDEHTDLEQVVITGYTRTTKKRITGSVATLSSGDLKVTPAANIDQLLQGKMTGVDVKNVSGRPGEVAKVRIRGTNTITGNAEPLWVVDGVPLQRDIPKIESSRIKSEDLSEIFANGISGINPNDIASVTVLKDASATAIYGSRAAGGVIVITTKRGEAGRLRVNYSSNISLLTSPPRGLNLMNAKEKLAWEEELWQEFSVKGFASGGHYPVIGRVGQIRSGYGRYKGWAKETQDAEIKRLGEETTDWTKHIFRQGFSHSHYLSLSGGTQQNTYYVSLGHDNNQGLLRGNDYNRYSTSVKLDMRPNERLKIGLSLDMSMQRSLSPALFVDPFKYAYFANPYERPYNADGSYSSDETFYALRASNGISDIQTPPNGFNILREMNETSNESNNYSATAIATLSYRILPQLNFEGFASYGYVSNQADNIQGKETQAAWVDRTFGDGPTTKRTYGSILQTASSNKSYNLRAQLNFSNTFGKKHYLSSLLGTELRGQYGKSIFEKRYGYDPVSGNSSTPVYNSQGTPSTSNLEDYARIVDALSGQSISETRFASFYFSTDYAFDRRYIASFTARLDGSNSFGRKEQFNPTGSLGLSWNVDQERFFEGLKPAFSSFTLRTALGYTGNINRSVFPELVMDYRTSFRKTEDETYRMGWIKKAPNPKLRWEKTRDFKLGLEMGFLKDRLRFSAEFYDRRTRDAVSSLRVPEYNGFASQTYNTSEILNQGWEFSLYASILRSKDWSISTNLNLSYNRNELLKFDTDSQGLSAGTVVGYPLGAIFSGRVQGIDKRLGIYSYIPRTDAIFESVADRERRENYLFYLGTGSAPIHGGYSINITHKNLSLNIGGSYSLGAIVTREINNVASYNKLGGSVTETPPTQENDLYVNHLNVDRSATQRWTASNPRTDAKPRIIDAYGDFLGLANYVPNRSESITRASMFESASYFKVGSASLSYAFPNKITKFLGISSLTTSFTVNNLLILTDYSGLDPETPGAVYPIGRSYMFGLSLGI